MANGEQALKMSIRFVQHSRRLLKLSFNIKCSTAFITKTVAYELFFVSPNSF